MRKLTRKQAERLKERADEIHSLNYPDGWSEAYEEAIDEITAKRGDADPLEQEILELAWDLTMHAPLGSSSSAHAVDVLLRLDTKKEWKEHPRLVLAVKYAGRLDREVGI